MYATDASIYQIVPLGVVVPRTADDVEAALAIARECGVPVTARGGGTSQCGQTVNHGLIVDVSRHLRELVSVDTVARRARVQPGIVLDDLNRALKPHGLFFPVDPSTASRATIGGMTANNSSGARSIRYGIMADNVAGIDAVLADGTRAYFGEVPAAERDGEGSPRYRELVERVRMIAAREADEIAARIPKVQRNVGGYAIHRARADGPFNMAHLLVGSEGTLAFFRTIDLELQPLPRAKALGVCHFPAFADAMRSTEALVALGPVAVELVDRTMIELSRAIAAFAPIMAKYVRGEPGSLLLVEFTGDDPEPPARKLDELDETMAELGFPHAVVKLTDAAQQAEMWEVRAAGLNIMTSMRGDAKPVSIVEDCAVPLRHLAAYTERLNAIFAKHGTTGTFYAHASVGCLHVRPVLNVKRDEDVGKLRAIAEETFALVREYGGAHSGEHGDGIVRSEFHEEMFGARIVAAFREIKHAFDPDERAESRQDRRRAEDGRPHAVPVRSGVRRAAARAGPRLVGVERVRGRRRDVQQQRRVPEEHGRRDVPVVPRHRRRAPRHARPRERTTARADGTAGPGWAHVAGAVRRARPVRVVQGVQARVPDGRRHGAHEDRVSGALSREARDAVGGSDRRGTAARGARARTAAPARERRDARARRARDRRAHDRLHHEARAAAIPPAAVPRPARARNRGAERTRRAERRRRALRRHVQPLVRSRRRARGAAHAGSGRLSRRRAGRERRRAAAVLRPNVPPGGTDCAGTHRGAPDDRGTAAVRRARHADRGPRAVVPPHAARRVSRARAFGRGAARRRRSRCCSRSSSRARSTRRDGIRRCGDSTSAHCCTGTVIRKRSARCRR